MSKKLRFFFVVATLTCLAVAPLNAASFTYFNDSTSYNAALGSTVLNIQDFSGFSQADNLDGIDFLPGVNVTSNLSDITGWVSPSLANSPMLFALGSDIRGSVGAFYDINIDASYNTVQFTIEGWNPALAGPGTIDIFYSDSTSSSLQLFQTGASELDPVFFAIISDASIDRIRWNEFAGEETGLDNIGVGNVDSNSIPEPGTMLLLGSGLLGLVGFRKKS